MCERDKLILKMNFPAVLHIQYSKAVCLSMGLALVYETHYSGGPCVSEKSSKEAGDWLLVAKATNNYLMLFLGPVSTLPHFLLVAPPNTPSSWNSLLAWVPGEMVWRQLIMAVCATAVW